MTVKDGRTTIIVQVQPNASQNGLVRYTNGVLHLKIAAPPLKGKANKELVKFLSGIFKVSRGNLTVEKGMTSRRKVITIRGLTQDQIMGQLERLAVEQETGEAV